jgi:RNA-directed DNA polymerase
MEGNKKTFILKKLADIPIARYVKIKKDANPFDSEWEDYFEKRRLKRLKVRSAKAQLYRPKTCKSQRTGLIL